MMPAHAAAAGYASPARNGVGAACFCMGFLSDEHGMDVTISARRLPVSGYPLAVPETCHALFGLQ
jgi:hypothetical protein